MNQYPTAKLLLNRAALLLFAASVSAQVTPPSAAPDEKKVVLSPFTVTSEANQGYRATSTLAGTRINTNLSDIGSAISVITEQVFKDTGSTNAETILPYALNTEVSGVQGNFADVKVTGSNQVNSNGVINSQNSTRIRGLSPALLARGLFRTDIPFDSYNTSAITINRGPNSLLFGASTPGGVIDQTLKQANFGKDTFEAESRLSERESLRTVLDVNHVLLKDRLALRLSFLDEKTNYQQRPTKKDEKRAYIATRAKLFDGFESGIIGRTTLRANAEFGEVKSTPPQILPPGDGLSAWFQAPSRSLQQYTGTTFPGWVDTFTPKTTLDNRLGTLVETALPLSATQPFFINMPYIYAQPNLSAPSMGIPGRSYVGGMPNRTLWAGVGGRGRVDGFGTSSFFTGLPTAFTPGFTVPVVMDRSIFDNQNMSITGTMPYRNYDFDAKSFALEQELFGGKGGIELAYDTQRYNNNYHNPFSGGGGNTSRSYQLRVDVMRYLQTGEANPNVGRVYLSDFSTAIREEQTKRDSKQATGFYNLDLTEKTGFARFLGRHVFTGFLSEHTANQVNRTYQNKWVDIPGSTTRIQTIVNDRLNGERRNAPVMVYLSDSLMGSNVRSASDIHLRQYITAPSPQPGDRVTAEYHSFSVGPENTTGPGAPLDQAAFELYRSLIGGNAIREINKSKTLSWQSYLFDGNLVGLFGWRKDTFKTVENISLANFLLEQPGAIADGLLASGEFDGRQIRIANESNAAHAAQISSVSAETKTWSLVGHLPERLIKLPYGVHLSAHYNQSESFVPTRTRRDFNGKVIPPETGATKEYGFTVESPNRRVSMRVNWFELQQKDASADTNLGFGFDGALRFWKDAELQGIPFESALNAGLSSRPNLTPNITSYAQMYDAIINLLPARQREIANYRFAADGRTVQRDPNPGQTVTTNASTKGVEVDLGGNITDNWRVVLNWGHQETITDDTAPVAGPIILAIAGNIAKAGFTGVSTQPSLGGGNSFGNASNGSVNALIAAKAKDGTASAEQRRDRVNLISTYSFAQHSKFKGFTVGGALRWQSRIATGYRTQVSSSGIVTPIISQPFFGPDEMNGDAWVSYRKRLKFGGRPINWTIQLNVRNLIGTNDYIPVITNPDGNVAVVRNPPTKEWFLTNSFSF